MYPEDWPPANAPLEHLEDMIAVAFYEPTIESYLLPTATEEERLWAASFYDDEREAYERLDLIVRETLCEPFGFSSLAETPGLQHGYRRVPPRTGGAVGPHDVVVVLGHVNEVVQQLGGWLEVAKLLLAVSKGGRAPMDDFADKRNVPRSKAEQVFTVRSLEALCREFIWRSYRIPPSDVVSCRIETQPVVFSGKIVGSEKHPIGNERHRVELVTRTKSLVFVTDSFGRCFEHWEWSGSKRQSLLLPNLLETG